MNLWEFLLGVVIVTTIGAVLKARYGIRETREGDVSIHDSRSAENARLLDEVRALRERVHVLERVITDNESGARIDREIERLRDNNRA